MTLNNKIILVLLVIVSVGFRMSRPDTFSAPLDKTQINKLNEALEDLFYLQQGEYNFDVETTPKYNADNGSQWFIETGNVTRLQFTNNDSVYTITPDAYDTDNLNVRTAAPTSPSEGDTWLIETGNTVYMQYRANAHTYTITPDGF